MTARPPCPACAAPMLLRKQIASNGAVQIGWYCMTCETWGMPGQWVPHKEIAGQLAFGGWTIENIPIVNDYRDVPCAICGKIGTEVHHWMPQKFKDHPDVEAEWQAWQAQTAPLCKYHHDLWHDLVTPWMPRRGNSRRKANG